MRILLPVQPKTVIAKRAGTSAVNINTTWHSASNTCLLTFENSSEGVQVEVKW